MAALAGGAAAVVWACGPFVVDLVTVRATFPAHASEYAAGTLGVVQPHYARVYLAQAYRVFSGRPPMTDALRLAVHCGDPASGEPCSTDPEPAIAAWLGAASRIVGALRDADRPGALKTLRANAFAVFTNCPAPAFAHAVRTLNARVKTYGSTSARVRSWTRAQIDVFRNCESRERFLPESLPNDADAAARADHAYQVAAAHFYAMEFDEAATRFRAIARDGGSPWRIYGRYLAARALIRKATLPDDRTPDTAAAMKAAEGELQDVVKDQAAAALHASARGLLGYIALRERPVERLHELARIVATDPNPDDQTLIDYRFLMDRLLENGSSTVTFNYAAIANRDALTGGDDLTDWVLVMQGRGDGAVARAVERWRATQSVPWLVAALWHVWPGHAAATELLDAARKVPASSPATSTLAFLRVRFLTQAGRRADARALLATLPTKSGDGVTPEMLNLIRAQRLLVADTFDEMLANAARTVVGDEDTGREVFDDDAGEIFTYHLPIARLIEASKSAHLPARLRTRVAIAALARAIVLRRHELGATAVTIVRERAADDGLRADLDRYLQAPDAETRQRAGLLLFMRTPGLHAFVLGLEDSFGDDSTVPDREFEHVFQRNWWCVSTEGRIGFDFHATSPLVALVMPGGRVPPPAFLSDAERAAAAQEVQQLRELGSPRMYLTNEAIRWARARPTDLNAAEALALAVEGGRWTCGDWEPSRLAFQTLHRLFPKSEWARRTRYWYK